MWNTSVKVDFLANQLIDSMDAFSISGQEKHFNDVVQELKKHFKGCSDEEILDIISLCMKTRSSVEKEHAELVLTAPDSFKVKARKTKDVLAELLKGAEKSITITGYSISDHFEDMLDAIIDRSLHGVYVKLYVNDLDKQKGSLNRLMSYRNKFLQVYEYQKSNDDKMAALHAKILVVDARRSFVSSANLSYHGMEGNIEMGFLLDSIDKAKQIEEVLKELVRMKVFCPVKDTP